MRMRNVKQYRDMEYATRSQLPTAQSVSTKSPSSTLAYPCSLLTSRGNVDLTLPAARIATFFSSGADNGSRRFGDLGDWLGYALCMPIQYRYRLFFPLHFPKVKE